MRTKEKVVSLSLKYSWTVFLQVWTFFHFLPSLLWQPGQLTPSSVHRDVTYLENILQKPLSSSSFLLILLLKTSLFSVLFFSAPNSLSVPKTLNWTARLSWPASWLAGSIQEVGPRLAAVRILLQSSGVLRLPDVCPAAAGWQELCAEAAFKHADAHRSKFSSSVGFLVWVGEVTGYESEIRDWGLRGELMFTSRKLNHHEGKTPLP